MLRFEPVVNASEASCPTHCAMGSWIIRQMLMKSKKKYLAPQIFGPEPTAKEVFVPTSQPIFISQQKELAKIVSKK